MVVGLEDVFVGTGGVAEEVDGLFSYYLRRCIVDVFGDVVYRVVFGVEVDYAYVTVIVVVVGCVGKGVLAFEVRLFHFVVFEIV